MSQYRELLKLFRTRFFESDALAEGSGYETNLVQISSILITIGAMLGLFNVGAFIGLNFHSSPDLKWMLRGYWLFFAAYAFSATGFATVFEWDMLFPDRRDFLILIPFPIRMRDLFAAKLASIGIFLGIVAAAVNGPCIVILFLYSVIYWLFSAGLNVTFSALAGVFLMHVVTCAASSAFAFLCVAGLQGLLINLTTPRLFRRISPYVQMAAMSLMVLSILLFPIYANLRFIAAAHPGWLWYFPPYWFMGMHPDPLFGSLGLFGWKALECALIMFCALWSVGFARHFRRTLESEDTKSRPLRSRRYFDWLPGSQTERAVFCFSGVTLARSPTHRLFLATYLSAGLSLGAIVMVTVSRGGVIGVSPEGVRAFPLLVTFFLISGFRACFQFPAELKSNWPFLMTEAGWGPAARDGTRKRVLVSGLLPALMIFFPFEIARWGVSTGLLHIAFQAAAGALLIEALFWTFDKIPFTCSYFPGKMNLALLVVIYLYGFTTYSFTMADLEASLEHDLTRSVVVFGAAAILLGLLWRRKSRAAPVLFDASEPEILSLNLWN